MSVLSFYIETNTDINATMKKIIIQALSFGIIFWAIYPLVSFLFDWKWDTSSYNLTTLLSGIVSGFMYAFLMKWIEKMKKS